MDGGWLPWDWGVWFPHSDIVRHVAGQDPDVLFFSGDQLYEHVGGYGIIRTPADRSILNYLRKWYLLGWAFGDTSTDVPIPALGSNVIWNLSTNTLMAVMLVVAA